VFAQRRLPEHAQGSPRGAGLGVGGGARRCDGQKAGDGDAFGPRLPDGGALAFMWPKHKKPFCLSWFPICLDVLFELVPHEGEEERSPD